MATGVMTTNCLAAADMLAKDGHDVSVVHFHTIKPLDDEAVLEFACDARLVVTVEEGMLIGGFGSAVTDVSGREPWRGDARRCMRIGLPDAFPHKYGLQEELFEVYGLTAGPDCGANRQVSRDKGKSGLTGPRRGRNLQPRRRPRPALRRRPGLPPPRREG